ncbi:MAG: hypothetical protein AB7P04_03280 [Bacteriovoracia bacterium]
MKNSKWIVGLAAVGIFVFSGAAMAKPKLSLPEIQRRAATYHLQKAEQAELSAVGLLDVEITSGDEEENDRCRPSRSPSPACMDYVAGSFPTTDDRLEAARICAGTRDLVCAEYVAGAFPTKETRIGAVQVCRGNQGIACAEFVSGSFPTSGTRKQAVEACRWADVECVKAVAGSFPTSDTRLAAARACGGR